VYDSVRPPGVDQGSIDSFNFLIKRRKQICKDREMRLSGHFSYQFNFTDLSAAETLSIAKYAQKSTGRRMSLGNNSECPVIVRFASRSPCCKQELLNNKRLPLSAILALSPS